MDQPESRYTLHCGDSRDVLREIPDNHFDAVVTDPPYALTAGKKGGSGVASIGPDNPFSRARIGVGNGPGGFMGQAWDSELPSVELWAEILRVAKPGAHLLAFGGTRTHHRLMCAIEDAGWEIRDCVMWVYGSGFPKYLDVSKAIDKAGGRNPKAQAAVLRRARERTGMTRADVATVVGCTESSVRDWEEGRARASGGSVEYITPSAQYRAALASLLGYTDDERRVCGVATDRRGDGTVYGVGHSGVIRSGGNTAASQQWTGWTTALKPAWEPIILARKPLVGTVAANVLEYGTGALNIDGCRIPREGPPIRAPQSDPAARGGVVGTDLGISRADKDKFQAAQRASIERTNTLGSYPANVIHDGSDDVLSLFPRTSSGKGAVKRASAKENNGNRSPTYGAESRPEGTLMVSYGDAGSAARFFYCAKASKSDKGADNPHPTVKPTALMRYLCRLVTPPGGVVLDPFMGSGSTGVAAIAEGFKFFGVEREPAYFAYAERRLHEPHQKS